MKKNLWIPILSLLLAAWTAPVRAGEFQEVPDNEKPIVILTYHRMTAKVVKRNQHVDMDPVMFERQLAWLRANGYQSVGLDVFLKENAGMKLPEKPFIITLDDGNRSDFLTALPILKKYGFHATCYVCPVAIGFPANMNWEQCEQMLRLGFGFECHTNMHWHLPTVLNGETSEAYLQRIGEELVNSRLLLEKKLNKPVLHLCYPYGDFNEVVEALVKKAGYKTAALCTKGPNFIGSDPLRLRRCMVDRSVSFEKFKSYFDVLPLKVDGLQPAEGSLVSRRPVLTARVLDDRVDLSTLKFYMGDVSHPTVFIDKTRELKCLVPYKLKLGEHIATVSGLDRLTGKKRSFSWSFSVKYGSKQALYKKIGKLLASGYDPLARAVTSTAVPSMKPTIHPDLSLTPDLEMPGESK